MEAVSTRLRLREPVSGHGACDKIVQLAGLDSTQIDRRLSSAAGKGR